MRESENNRQIQIWPAGQLVSGEYVYLDTKWDFRATTIGWESAIKHSGIIRIDWALAEKLSWVAQGAYMLNGWSCYIHTKRQEAWLPGVVKEQDFDVTLITHVKSGVRPSHCYYNSYFSAGISSNPFQYVTLTVLLVPWAWLIYIPLWTFSMQRGIRNQIRNMIGVLWQLRTL